MRQRRLVTMSVLVTLLLGALPAADAEFPFPAAPGSGSPYDYTRLHIANGSCDGVPPGQRVPAGSDLPASFDCRDTFKLSDYAAVPTDADYDPLVAQNPQELYGVRGPGTNRAWEVTTGRPDTVIAVMDSGIRWDENRQNLMRKFFLNRGELPLPNGSAKGGTVPDYDLNRDGAFNVDDYAGDPRAADDPDDDNELVDPGDLIRAFSDGVDDDGNGYVDDISGWDFFEGDNDPNDDVDYGHGTGESEDSAGEVGTDLNPQCPNCMLLEMRVGDSFIADVNHFAEAAYYAVDNGASVIQSALGTINHTRFSQQAADYAYEHGVLFVASAADESSGHHNYPSALNHTMTVNSVTPAIDTDEVGLPIPPVALQRPATWLAFNGCTNYGGYIWVAVASTSCSSDAVGQTAGVAGLLYSAARNAVDLGIIQPDRSGMPVSAEEAKQLFRLAADDIDFATPKPPLGLPLNFGTTLPASIRYVTTAGWDQVTGFGRSNTNAIVRHVAAGQIPPEADITGPRWWQPLDARGVVQVTGRVDSPRSGSYSYEVQYAPGVQPPPWPAGDRWTTVASGTDDEPRAGVLATIDLAQVRHAIDAAVPPYVPGTDPTSPTLPEKDAFRIRIVVHADGDTTTPWRTAVAQLQAFAAADPTLVPGWPVFLEGDGVGSPAFEDLDADGVDELVVGTGNGAVHAFKIDGSEPEGWPVWTGRLPLPPGLPEVHAPVMTGAPVVADLDGDGRPEVAVADLGGDLHVWDNRGRVRPGFPVRANPSFSHETACQRSLGPNCDDDGPVDVRDEINTVVEGFTSQPSAGDLDRGFPGVELVAGSNDGHVYAWHSDGTAVDGWPVLLRDPAKVAGVDPVSHRVAFVDGSGVKFGRKVLATPSVGDVDGDGDLEVAVNVNEEYEERPNTSEVLFEVLGLVESPGNTRIYLLHHDGRAHPESAAQAATPHPDDQAYVAGWPVPIAMAVLELLPTVGEGSNGAPVLADIDEDGQLEIMTASIAGPPYALRGDGSSFYGEGSDGRYRTMATSIPGVGSLATDLPSVASLGGGAAGHVGGRLFGLSFAMGSTGLRRLLDVVLPEQQLAAEDHVGVWSARGGQFQPGFPAHMNDLQFINTPAIADVSGDGLAEVLHSSAMYDVTAYGAAGLPAPGFPKFTGGWSVITPAVGDLDGDGVMELAVNTREGNLFVWRTAGAACQPVEWPKNGHDLHNTGVYGTDADRPGMVGDLVARRVATSIVLTFVGTGDDGSCGSAATYEVHAGGRAYTVRGGTGSRYAILDARGLPAGALEVTVTALDDSGNKGFGVTVPTTTVR